jgi:pSer/pThr/pTyr-binding forkhead associated (FHA) protein
LRQAPTECGEIGEFTGPATVELPSEEREFVSDCRSLLPLRLSVSNERSGETEDVVIDRPWAVIGGAENCDLRILHPDISQRHAYLQFADGRLFCCDLASRTGTHRAKGGRLSGWLTPGEPIYLGPYSIRAYPNDFLTEEGDLAPHVGDSAPIGDFPPVAFTIANVYDRSGRPKMRHIRRLVTLAGASQACPLRLSHASVGRAHCSFVWTPAGLWVVDLLCDGGTLVNGRPVSLAHLREGDEVGIGRFQLHLTYAPPPDDEPVVPRKAESSGDLPAPPAPPSESNFVSRVSPPRIVFASADLEDEPVIVAEPIALQVARPVAEAAAATPVAEVESALPCTPSGSGGRSTWQVDRSSSCDAAIDSRSFAAGSPGDGPDATGFDDPAAVFRSDSAIAGDDDAGIWPGARAANRPCPCRIASHP